MAAACARTSMTSSRPRGVISRLSSRGGTEASNVTSRRLTVQSAYNSCRAVLHGSSVYMDQYIRARVSGRDSPPRARNGVQERAAACGDTRSRNRTPRCNRSSRGRRWMLPWHARRCRPQNARGSPIRCGAFYKDQNYQLIWIDGDRPSERYRQFMKALDAADAHGLPARALHHAD